jgi:hypothetical protein
MAAETLVRSDNVRIPRHRESTGSCMDLAVSIRDEGLRHPITLWKDGTLISGERRLFAHILMEIPRIPVIYVHTIEDAAKRLLEDNQDEYLSTPQTWSEICRVWQTLRRLDEPAALKRYEAAQRRGVQLRKQTMRGQRVSGRSTTRSDDYVLSVMCEPYDISYATANRVEIVWKAANGFTEEPGPRRDLAKEIMAGFDNGAPVWPGYQRYMAARPSRATGAMSPRGVATMRSAAVAKQRAAWDRSLPQLEGLIAGLIELGPPKPGRRSARSTPALRRPAARSKR